MAVSPVDVRRRFRQVLRALRHECPLLLPARVVLESRRPPLPRRESYGPAHWCGWSSVTPGPGFRIVVRTHVYERGARRSRPLYPSEAVETLVHEWAHCMSWTEDHITLEDHGPLWALSYGICYRAIIED